MLEPTVTVPAMVRRSLAVAILLVASAAACSDPIAPPTARRLNGPSGIAFSCYGQMRVTSGQPADASQPIITTAMPASACRAWDAWIRDSDDSGPVPAGQGPLPDASIPAEDFQEQIEIWQDQVNLLGFVVQRQAGTLALIARALGPNGDVLGLTTVDADRLTPGQNTIPVGTLPVGVATDPTGCHVMTVNAGDCDISLLGVNQIRQAEGLPAVQRFPIHNAADEPIGARPHAMVGQPADAPLGFECPAQPESYLYVAYPDCNMVAVVHAATGEVKAGIQLREDGTAEITDGNVSCGTTTTCGSVVEPPGNGGPDASPVSDAGMIPDAGNVPDAGLADAGTADAGVTIRAGGAPRPVALHVAVQGATRRLYIGAENSPSITVVELDEAFLPQTSWSVALEGEIGITSLAASQLITNKSGGQFRFLYAVATDDTVRVADVHNQRRECDTQIDPRFSRDVNSSNLLSCMPLGDPALPRRPGARSPGIHLPNGALPLSVGLANVNEEQGVTTGPDTFAFITMSTGGTQVVKVYQRDYDVFENAEDPLQVDIALTMSHQVRDTGTRRSESLYCKGPDDTDMDGGVPDAGSGPISDERVCDFEAPVASCAFPAGTQSTAVPQIPSAPLVSGDNALFSLDNIEYMPVLRQLTCEEPDPDTAGALIRTSVPELSFMAPDYLREYGFPDLQSVRNETWTLTWEGRVSRDSATSDVNGPPVRIGLVTRDNGFELRDGNRPFCKMGVEPYDAVTLVGCEPDRADVHCKVDETCYVHPDAPSSITSGVCLPTAQLDALSGVCRDFLSSRRRFTVLETYTDRLVLAERRRVLRTTPVSGCESASQCEALFEIERALSEDDPEGMENRAIDLCPEAGDSTFTWACEEDPSHAPGAKRCLMTCTENSECEEGWLCSDGYCVEGAEPPAACVAALQRYDVRVGEAFAVIGERTGFLHGRMADPATGMCIDDPDAHPLAIGRLPLVAPPCPSDDITGIADLAGIEELLPNPCSVTVSHTSSQWNEQAMQDELVTRDTPAIRFRNPALTFHLANPVLDVQCSQDAPALQIPTVFLNYVLSFVVNGGFLPQEVGTSATFGGLAYAVKYPVAIVSGPLEDLWIMDQGETSAAIRGQVVRIDPRALSGSGDGVQ